MTQPLRSHYEIPLKTAASSGRFQPTGFPDLGAALFRRPVGKSDWLECLHVESPQSMANRLELTTWDEPGQRQALLLDGVPYLQVVNADGEFLTSSRTEPHRLASSYVMDGIVGDTGQTGHEWLPGRLGLESGKPMNHTRLARAVYELDPLSLIHGVFFAQSKGGWVRQPKIARAVTTFIDAMDVMPAVSGGVKGDYVDTAGGHSDTGYGMVPHSRVEYTARCITAHLTIDHQQLRGYGLGERETELLEAVIGFEVTSLFGAGGLRLRTACEFMIDEKDERAAASASLIDIEAATTRLTAAVDAARDTLGDVTTVRYAPTSKGARSKKAQQA